MATKGQGLLPRRPPCQTVQGVKGIIQIDVRIQGHRAKAVYDPGRSGVGLSAAWAARHALGTSTQMPLTIASADGISTIKREVYKGLQIE